MKRAASLLIVVTLAVAPVTDSILCFVWCAAAHPATGDPAACHRLAQLHPAVGAGDGACGILLANTLFVREETRQEVPTLALERGGPIARTREIAGGGRIGIAIQPPGEFAHPGFTVALRI